jgi:hypothetical protein
MIKRPIQSTKLAVLQVIASYQVKGTPELDLIDENGVLYEGCSLVSLGGGRVDFLTIPQKNQEVLVYLDPIGTPVVLGALEQQTKFVDDPEVNSAGEYSTTSVALDDSSLQAGDTRVLVSDSLNKVFLSPAVRVQGSFEVSNGNIPSQSVAVAEPLLETLEEYRTFLDAIRKAINEAGLIDQQIAVAQAIPDPVKVAELTELKAILSLSIPAPHGTIVSELLKTEK